MNENRKTQINKPRWQMLQSKTRARHKIEFSPFPSSVSGTFPYLVRFLLQHTRWSFLQNSLPSRKNVPSITHIGTFLLRDHGVRNPPASPSRLEAHRLREVTHDLGSKHGSCKTPLQHTKPVACGHEYAKRNGENGNIACLPRTKLMASGMTMQKNERSTWKHHTC